MTLDQCIQGWKATYPGRESFITDCVTLFSSSPPAFIYICDPFTAADTARLLDSILEGLKEPTEESTRVSSVHLDAVECTSPKLIFDRVLNSIVGWTPDWQNGCLNWCSEEKYSDSLDGFLHGIRACAATVKSTNIVLLFDNAERLQDNVPTLLTPLARLADLANLPMSIVFLSQLPWEEVRFTIGSAAIPFVFTLNPLGSNDLKAQLKQRFISLQDESTINAFHPVLEQNFSTFSELMMGICAPYTFDPNEAIYVIAAMWPQYISPILNDWNDSLQRGEEYFIPSSSMARFNKASILTTFHALYSRKLHATEWAVANSSSEAPRFSKIMTAEMNQGIVHAHAQPEMDDRFSGLPHTAKYLLVASFLASYNPSRSDPRMLSQAKEGKSRRHALPRKPRFGAVQKLPQTLSGPSSFTYDRLWAICGSLLETKGKDDEQPVWEKDLFGPGVFSEMEVTRVLTTGQIADLVSRRLLVKASAQDKMGSSSTYKCAITMEQAESIAKSLNFSLGELLWEQAQ